MEEVLVVRQLGVVELDWAQRHLQCHRRQEAVPAVSSRQPLCE